MKKIVVILTCLFLLNLLLVSSVDIVGTSQVVEVIRNWVNEEGSTGQDAIAIGISTASGVASVAIGTGSTASGPFSVAIASGQAGGSNSLAIGGGNIASGDYSVAFGSETVASGANSITMGYQSKASNDNAIAIGVMPKASGVASTAMGFGIEAAGESTFAIALNDQRGTIVSQPNTLSIMGGKLGIGKVDPQKELDVIGDIRASGSICGNEGCVGGGSGPLNLQFYDEYPGTDVLGISGDWRTAEDTGIEVCLYRHFGRCLTAFDYNNNEIGCNVKYSDGARLAVCERDENVIGTNKGFDSGDRSCFERSYGDCLRAFDDDGNEVGCNANATVVECENLLRPSLKLNGLIMLYKTDYPVPCKNNNNMKGSVYYDLSLNEPCYCTGVGWKQFDGGGSC